MQLTVKVQVLIEVTKIYSRYFVALITPFNHHSYAEK